jgi:hypothetical protein
MSYGVLLVPGSRKMSPDGKLMSYEAASRLLELVKEGATIILSDRPDHTPGLDSKLQADSILTTVMNRLWSGKNSETSQPDNLQPEIWQVGKGTVIRGPWYPESLDLIGIERDVIATGEAGNHTDHIAWNHRASPDFDIYFISNQSDSSGILNLSLRVSGKIPELYNPLTGEIRYANQWKVQDGRTELPVKLEPDGSLFIVLSQATSETERNQGKNWIETAVIQPLEGEWKVSFDAEAGGPADTVIFNNLSDWSKHADPSIRYYSGTATYSKIFGWNHSVSEKERIWLDLGKVSDIAVVRINGKYCGTAWTFPFMVEITGALRNGENRADIEVTNTWANRLIGDHNLPENERISWTTAPYRLEGSSLQPSGLPGPVEICVSLK